MSDALDEAHRRIANMRRVAGISADIAAWFPVGFVAGAGWQRDRSPEVSIHASVGRPATCEVRRNGKLVFSGRDHSADMQTKIPKEVLRLLRNLVDPDECRFDHDGGCQAHSYLSLTHGETCPQADARKILAENGW